MRKITTILLNLLCGLVALGLLVFLFRERRAWSELDQANQKLRQQLTQTEAILTDNQRLLAMLPARDIQSSQSNRESATVSALSEPAKELLQLRGEAQALRQENKIIEAFRKDTRQAHVAQATVANTNSQAARPQSSRANSTASQLEILSAVYGTDNAHVDITEDLKNRIRDDSLKTVVNNNIKGDPEFGQVKNLTIEYRYGGVTFTNQFREGALVVLPPEPTP